jgi:spoIIIJ-associated protein
MEWVETTGKTVDEAKELALDQLGVDENEAEFELLEEPKTGLFGRSRGTARVRARILPRAPRAKTERKRRPKKTEGAGEAAAPRTTNARRTSEGGGARRQPAKETAAAVAVTDAPESTEAAPRERASGTNGGRRRQGGSDASSSGGDRTERNKEPMDQAEQITVLEEFLTGLAESFGLAVQASSEFEDEDLRVNLTGDELGLLVGPRLATLDAIQEIARNTLQRQAAGREYARVSVDVEGIRERRSAALTEFVTSAAEQVRTDGSVVVFEVMSSADRKQVHDVAGELDGVASASEGEDPRRRVVLRQV